MASFRADARDWGNEMSFLKPLSTDTTRDKLMTVADGAIVLSKTVCQKDALPRQIELYRQYIEADFMGTR